MNALDALLAEVEDALVVAVMAELLADGDGHAKDPRGRELRAMYDLTPDGRLVMGAL